MRILAIGLGGAGGRIVNHLYRTDRRSSKVACVQALAVDIDLDSIGKLSDLPGNAKIYFPPLGVTRPDEGDQSQTATIDMAEIAARAQTMATGETDAVFLIMGLGGSMADDAPSIITTLRSSMTEPIFALVTLPCLSEGVRRSAKAADQIEMIFPLVDGVILFDNETWHKKVKIAEKMQPASDRGLASKIGLITKKKEPVESPEERMHNQLNDVIVRRVSLILRAGEFKADGGLELAEVVLDAGEVLNTMKGMGFITIGYAVEQLPSHPLDFLTRLRPSTGFFADEHQKKASRIIDLAKQAIYHEISAPCDITSAHKALILVAGPSHELSMKGFMTVRKWIDRSIAGLETRSGDYPVMSTRFVAIIVMLTGLENVPRIAELKEIRADARDSTDEAALPSPTEDQAAEDSTEPSPRRERRDEMIKVPPEKIPPIPRFQQEPAPERHRATIAGPSQDSGHRVPSQPVVLHNTGKEEQKPTPRPVQRTDVPSDSIRKLLKSRSVRQKIPEATGTGGDMKGASEKERQKIEEELQRQRQMAFGRGLKQEPDLTGSSITRKERPISTDQGGLKQRDVHAEGEGSPIKHVLIRKQTAKKVIIHKKASRSENDTQEDGPDDTGSPSQKKNSSEGSASPVSPSDPQDHDLLDTWICQVRDQKKTLRTDEGTRTLTIEDAPVTAARDDALLHTSMKRERSRKGDPNHVAGIRKIETVREIEPAKKKRNRIKDDEDISFVE